MDSTVKKMFIEKNKQIFNNKIILDIENNIDSLKKSISNYIEISSAKLLRRVSSLLNDNNNGYTMSDLNILIECLKEELNKDIYKLIDTKKTKMNKLITKDESLDFKSFIKGIDESTNIFFDKLHSDILNDVNVNFYNDLSRKITLTTSVEKDALLNILNSHSISLYENIVDIVRLRDNSLKNISRDSKQRILDMNRKIIKKKD